MRKSALAVIVCLAATAAYAAPEEPADLQWIGFALNGGKTNAFLNTSDFQADKGKLTWTGPDKKDVEFQYGLSAPLYSIEKSDPAKYYKTRVPGFKVFLKTTKVGKGPAANARLVIAVPDGKDVPPVDTTFAMKDLRELPTALRATLGAKTLRDFFTVPAGTQVEVADKPQEQPAPDTIPAPTNQENDPLKTAIGNLCSRWTPGEEGKPPTNPVAQCKKVEPVFFYRALKDADSMKDGPDKTRMLKLREQVLKLGAKPWTNGDDPGPINALRSDPYVEQMQARYIVSGDNQITKDLSGAGLDYNQVLDDLCDTVRKGGGLFSGGRTFDTLRDAADKAAAASNEAKPEDIRTGAGWDPTTLSNKCEQRRQAMHKNDPRKVDWSGQNSTDGNAPGTGVGGTPPGDLAGGKFTKIDSEPPPAATPPANPYKDAINGAKWGIWGAVLGFIFGGPAGALLLGAAAAGAGYWISGYK